MPQETHNLSGTEALIRHISANGAMSVQSFMEFALFDPIYGYYTTAPHPIGREGDFITSPEISQIFGELIGIWCALRWEQMGKPSPLALVEIGPGKGTLMEDLLRGTTHIHGFHEAITLHLIERSPILTDKQRSRLSPLFPNITWHTHTTTLPPLPTIFIANELFDALPIDQWVTHHGHWHARQIGLKAEKQPIFTYDSAPLAISDQPEGTILETSPPSASMMKHMTSHLRRYTGAAVIIDYGYDTPGYGDTLQAIKSHAYAPVLDYIGRQDITAHVNFSALSSLAEDAGLHCAPVISQRTFLKQLGIDIRLKQLLHRASSHTRALLQTGVERLVDPAQMGVLFKVLAISHASISLQNG